ncbi:MAG TPA: hypothetical protein DEQ43_15100 [Nocardioides bacterium]|nr:hypothetical protein [Nocardioides sp.]
MLAVVVASAAALVATSLSTPAQASAPSAQAGTTTTTTSKTSKAGKHDRAWRAHAALVRAQKAFSPATPAKERPDATLALRKLWLLKDSLSPAERAAAEKLASRPDKPANTGAADPNILVHYDPAEINPAAFDANTALATLKNVADTYAGSGYRRPKPDKGRGGDDRIDIYLDTLPAGLYGYCTTDQSIKSTATKFDVWAFCVLDNDYAGFPPQHTPLQNLQVTAAHEYYHATQFAYDIADDGWFLEATATWAEDELYDSVDDNYQYLRNSPITKPGRPIDKFESNGTFHYGVWIFFRYLTEHYPAKTGAMPTLLLQMWQNADSSKGPRKDLFSVQAINKALKKVGHTSLAAQFAAFSAATPFPTSFSEGAGEATHPAYPSKKLSGSAALGAHKKKNFKAKLDHLSSATYEFVPGGGTSKLKLRFKMAPKSHGSRAVVVVVSTTGAILQTKNIKVNRRGVAGKKVLFDATVGKVQVTLVNASSNVFDCYRHTNNPISCSGKARFDNQRALLNAKAA